MRYGTIDADYARRLATTPPAEDGPVWMVTLMHHRDPGDDADAPFESLTAVGAELVFLADVDTQLLGDMPPWDRVAVVKYTTRRSAAHVHEDAGVAETIVIGGVPIASPPLPADAPGWDAVPHPPTAEDPAVVVLHVLRYHEGEPRQEMATYTDHASKIAVPHGVRIAGWFEAEGTIIGDGRTWHQARFNAFPSKAAFMAVALDPERLAAQHEHREVAIADTYTMILRPTIDRLAESIAEPTAG